MRRTRRCTWLNKRSLRTRKSSRGRRRSIERRLSRGRSASRRRSTPSKDSNRSRSTRETCSIKSPNPSGSTSWTTSCPSSPKDSLRYANARLKTPSTTSLNIYSDALSTSLTLIPHHIDVKLCCFKIIVNCSNSRSHYMYITKYISVNRNSLLFIVFLVGIRRVKVRSLGLLFVHSLNGNLIYVIILFFE